MFLNNGSYPVHAAATQEHLFIILNLVSDCVFFDVAGSCSIIRRTNNKMVLYEHQHN